MMNVLSRPSAPYEEHPQEDTSASGEPHQHEAPAGTTAPVSAGLTERDLLTLQLLARGYTNQQIARLLETTPSAVGHLVERVIKELGANHRAHAVAIAVRRGLIT